MLLRLLGLRAQRHLPPAKGLKYYLQRLLRWSFQKNPRSYGHRNGDLLVCVPAFRPFETAALVVFHKNEVPISSLCPIDRAGNFWYHKTKQETPKKTERRWVRCTASRQVIFTAVCRAVSSTRLLPEYLGTVKFVEMLRTDRQPAIRAYFYAQCFITDAEHNRTVPCVLRIINRF